MNPVIFLLCDQKEGIADFLKGDRHEPAAN
jgi:hypothetical protein